MLRLPEDRVQVRAVRLVLLECQGQLSRGMARAEAVGASVRVDRLLGLS